MKAHKGSRELVAPGFQSHEPKIKKIINLWYLQFHTIAKVMTAKRVTAT
jgi:hypothetical protein